MMQRIYELLIGDHFAHNRLGVAVAAEGAGIDPLEYEGRPVKVSAADFLAMLI